MKCELCLLCLRWLGCLHSITLLVRGGIQAKLVGVEITLQVKEFYGIITLVECYSTCGEKLKNGAEGFLESYFI